MEALIVEEFDSSLLQHPSSILRWLSIKVKNVSRDTSRVYLCEQLKKADKKFACFDPQRKSPPRPFFYVTGRLLMLLFWKNTLTTESQGGRFARRLRSTLLKIPSYVHFIPHVQLVQALTTDDKQKRNQFRVDMQKKLKHSELPSSVTQEVDNKIYVCSAFHTPSFLTENLSRKCVSKMCEKRVNFKTYFHRSNDFVTSLGIDTAHQDTLSFWHMSLFCVFNIVEFGYVPLPQWYIPTLSKELETSEKDLRSAVDLVGTEDNGKHWKKSKYRIRKLYREKYMQKYLT
ncbi:hypothetical protein GQR58_021483 [Nymphon striatum]|nr:hypothetical protein GQR58_021483 [Nymphon striatum]